VCVCVRQSVCVCVYVCVCMCVYVCACLELKLVTLRTPTPKLGLGASLGTGRSSSVHIYSNIYA
jgi:hypothetical protein